MLSTRTELRSRCLGTGGGSRALPLLLDFLDSSPPSIAADILFPLTEALRAGGGGGGISFAGVPVVGTGCAGGGGGGGMVGSMGAGEAEMGWDRVNGDGSAAVSPIEGGGLMAAVLRGVCCWLGRRGGGGAGAWTLTRRLEERDRVESNEDRRSEVSVSSC